MKKAAGFIFIICTLFASCQVPYNDGMISKTTAIEEEFSMMYTDFSEYHFPEELAGKGIGFADQGEPEFEFLESGIVRRTPTIIFPNPIMPDDFNTAKDGKTEEQVEKDGDNWDYHLFMSGNREYKGNMYYGDLKIDITFVDGILKLNGREAVIY